MFFPEISKLIVNGISPNGNHDGQNDKANSGWEDVSREKRDVLFWDFRSTLGRYFSQIICKNSNR